MIRLVMIITGLGTGGAELMLKRLIEGLDPRKYLISIISLTSGGELSEKIRANGIDVYELGMNPKITSIAKFVQLVRILRRLRPNIVHTWMYHADILGGIAARIAGVKPLIWCIRNGTISLTNTKTTTRRAVQIGATLSRCLPSIIVSCSRTAIEYHAGMGYCRSKMVFIPNGFDINRYKPNPAARAEVRAEIGASPSDLLVGLIGRYDPQKNHLGFIASARKIWQAVPSVRFVFVGTNVDTRNAQLGTALRLAGVDSITMLLGRRDDTERIMASLDLLVSSSTYGEAFPNVIAEAMSCGVPCVSTDIGDAREIIGETGFVVPVGHEREFEERIIEVLRMDPADKEQLGAAATVRIREHYDLTTIVRLYDDVYRRVLNQS
jgi:glycosyltransferase involved in cell wall biosynthesis